MRVTGSLGGDGDTASGSGNDGGRGRGGGGGGDPSAFAGAFLAARAAQHFSEPARVLICGVFPGVKAREVFLVQLAALVDLGNVQQLAVTRAHFGRVDPDVPRAGLVDDDLGEWLDFLLEFADTGNKGCAGQFGRRQRFQNGDGSGDTLWGGSGCSRNVLGVLGILGGGRRAFPRRIGENSDARGRRRFTNRWQGGALNGG